MNLNGLPKLFRLRQDHLQDRRVRRGHFEAILAHRHVSHGRARQIVLARLETGKIKSPRSSVVTAIPSAGKPTPFRVQRASAMGEPFALTTTPFKSCVWGSGHAAATETAKARTTPIG